jgi:hypothetical protein|tara:strand:+ start:528 stop:743 length:216 start_codon:yes stop_codon:yes gene_type:complete
MSILWVADKLKKHLKERKEDVTNSMLSGVKDMCQYEFLRGKYSSLVETELELTELLGRVIEDDDEEQGDST